MILPIFIPSGSSDPERCEHCKAVLRKVEICADCKTEIKEEESTPLDIIIGLVLLLAIATVLLAGGAVFMRFILFPILDFILL